MGSLEFWAMLERWCSFFSRAVVENGALSRCDRTESASEEKKRHERVKGIFSEQWKHTSTKTSSESVSTLFSPVRFVTNERCVLESFTTMTLSSLDS